MSLATDTKNSETFTQRAYEAIAEMGGELPKNKNLQNLAPTVDAMQTVTEGDGTLWGTLYTTQYPDGLTLNSKSDYDALSGGTGSSTNHNFSVNGLSINAGTITKFSFGSACAYTPGQFLSVSNIVTLEHTEVLRSISSYFLYNCNRFNSPLDLSNVEEIGHTFMYYCSAFAQPITLSKKVKTIGYAFMSKMGAFTGPVVINTTAIPKDVSNAYNSLSGATSHSAAHATGITIAGSEALAWKTALPDVSSSSNGYRKLILMEETL